MNIVLIILGIVIFAAVWVGANYFVARRLYQSTAYIFPKIKGKWFALFYALLALPLVLAFTIQPLLPLNLGYALRVIGAYWAGVFVYLLAFLLIAELVVLIFKIAKAKKMKNIRFYVNAAAVVFTAAVSVYGFYNATQLRVSSYEVQLLRPLKGAPINIVFISDLHLGEVHTERWLPRIVDGINKLEPDIVVILGDIFNDDFYIIRNPYRTSQQLRSINSTYGVFACLGNHDAGPTLNSMMTFLEQSNVMLLNEEHYIVDERLILIGRLDPYPIGGFGNMQRGELADILTAAHTDLYHRGLPLNLPVVVMDHNPINIREYENNVDLVLFGHTHRGQLFPGSLITRWMYVVDQGHYQTNTYSPHFIVTQGVHTWLMPMRVGSHNEIGSVIIR